MKAESPPLSLQANSRFARSFDASLATLESFLIMELSRRSGRARSNRKQTSEEPAELWEFDSLSESLSADSSPSSEGTVDGAELSDSSDDEASGVFDGAIFGLDKGSNGSCQLLIVSASMNQAQT